MVVSSLKFNYRKHNILKRFLNGEECPLISNYVNLVILKQPEEKTREEVNESIAIKELFDIEKGNSVERPSNKVVVFGRAGIGKTTMCKYIVSRWQHGSLWQNKFEAIFWLPLRELITYPEENFPSLLKIIQNKCIGHDHISEEDIEKFIVLNISKVLFILDGYN